jgi:NADH:ubiquinone oxidoreductase subunit 4 (subunit M)
MTIPFLSLMIFLPLVGMVIILCLDKERHIGAIRWTATSSPGLVFVISAARFQLISSQPGHAA